jgi:excisionase family DNA binding protein
VSNEIRNGDYDAYCGTSYAAKLLKLSVGTVQNLVEANKLKAWRTLGGHRRISMQSIYDYQSLNKLQPSVLQSREVRLRVLVVEDDENTRNMYQAHFDRWSLQLDVVMYASAMEALIDMPSMHPQVLLTDLNMPNMDGFKFLQTLREHKLFFDLPIIVLTGLSADQISKKGGLPNDIQVLQKPIDMEWLHGFFEALLNIKKINMKK